MKSVYYRTIFSGGRLDAFDYERRVGVVYSSCYVLRLTMIGMRLRMADGFLPTEGKLPGKLTCYDETIVGACYSSSSISIDG